jgi:hypothetical protein
VGEHGTTADPLELTPVRQLAENDLNRARELIEKAKAGEDIDWENIPEAHTWTSEFFDSVQNAAEEAFDSPDFDTDNRLASFIAAAMDQYGPSDGSLITHRGQPFSRDNSKQPRYGSTACRGAPGRWRHGLPG